MSQSRVELKSEALRILWGSRHGAACLLSWRRDDGLQWAGERALPALPTATRWDAPLHWEWHKFEPGDDHLAVSWVACEASIECRALLRAVPGCPALSWCWCINNRATETVHVASAPAWSLPLAVAPGAAVLRWPDCPATTARRLPTRPGRADSVALPPQQEPHILALQCEPLRCSLLAVLPQPPALTMELGDRAGTRQLDWTAALKLDILIAPGKHAWTPPALVGTSDQTSDNAQLLARAWLAAADLAAAP